MMRGTSLATLLTSCIVMADARGAEPSSAVDFARDVAPILEQHCVRCHQPKNKKGELSFSSMADLTASGFVVAHDAEASYLIEVVMPVGGAAPMMPKEGPPLSPEEVAKLRVWIDAGAEWPDDVVVKERSKADRSWWSLRPLAEHTPPTGYIPETWGRNPIDQFVYARMTTDGLTPNGPADKRVLIRRVTYDLTGLPPTPAEIDAFVVDESPEAYERLVDRLLASPRYGEHWGRHWLDVVRYGESTGFEVNHLVENIWPYRDYVIRAFNDDKPFDQFVAEQLAGDAVGKGNPDVEVGLTYLVCGPYDIVGNKDAAQAAQIRADTVDEMVRTTSEAFLGLTVGCARCHDHKFDPITQQDYYQLYATFAGVYHDDRKLAEDKPPLRIGRFEQPVSPQRVFERGDAMRKGATVVPASMSTLGDAAKPYALVADAPEQERRISLARWLTAPDNPLTPRVLANRLWQHHFGTGIVATPSDFGYMGEKPTHPELLDWLARQLVAEGWRLKPMHKLIVMSQTYRQSSEYRVDAGAKDADARLLWRFPPRRLGAEEIRDTMLFVSGKLNEQLGGPGFRLYEYARDNVATYTPLAEFGPDTYRRSVYHQSARASRIDLLSDFDAPDCAFSIARRVPTTTPSQALALMNHSFTLRMAEGLAERVAKDAGTDSTAQVGRVFELAVSRKPSPEEQASAVQLVNEHGLRALCRAMLNSSELIYVK